MNKDLLARLVDRFPEVNFIEGADFKWEPSSKTIFWASSEHFEAQILHEIGHFLAGHFDFKMDIDLLKMELEAWEKAKIIAREYGVRISQNLIEDHLDTYRDWLHRRSLCPNCQINGFQMKNCDYRCPACESEWRANSAKFQELRRRKIK